MSDRSGLTDRQILQAIYDEYIEQFPGPHDKNDPFMAVDFAVIAKRLNGNARLISGRLQALSLQHYRYDSGNGLIELYSLYVAGKGPSVRFPMLASALADYRERHRQQQEVVRLSVLSIIVAAIALTLQLVGMIWE
jgi:hypothetical protein